jgi:putative colanic acid biosynthesis UDP-glucose lipid carrier transferase
MISARLRGFNLLYGIILVVLMPLWFGVSAFVGVVGWEVMAHYQVNYPLYLLAVAIAFLLSGSYRIPENASGPSRNFWMAAVRQTNRDMVLHALMIFGIIYATKDKAISRQFIGAYLVASWAFLLLLHRYLPPLLARRVFHKETQIRSLLIGSPEKAKKLVPWAEDQARVGIHVVGLITYDKVQEPPADFGLPILGDIAKLDEVIEAKQIQQVVLLETRHSKAFVQFIAESCERAGVRILIFNPWEEFFHKPMQAVPAGEFTFFTPSDEPLQNPVNRLLKRLLDLAVAIPVVVLILPILCVLVKIMQMVQAPGPLFYRQTRSGAERHQFKIYKFRTMRVREAKDEAQQASKGDPRIFPFGRFLRVTSLDEFPQFLNVLGGSMSVVGPRPHLLEHDEEFAKLAEIYRTRHFVKPGITGMAQHKGYRGEILRPEDLQNRLNYDLQYINRWSIWLDLGIIIKTFAAVIFPPKTAY